jgi:hypothetical protein
LVKNLSAIEKVLYFHTPQFTTPISPLTFFERFSMRKLFFLFILVGIIYIATPQQSQAQVLTGGSSALDVGLNFGASRSLTPFGRYEYGAIGIGPGTIGISGAAFFAISGGSINLGIGPEVSYHLQLTSLPPNLDLFGGLGFYFGVASGEGFGSTFGAHVGARYYINDRFGFTLLLGNVYTGSLGVSFKL